MAPLPAESQAAKRTHFLPVASKGISKCLLPIGGRSVVEITWRLDVLPSPQTTSTKFKGKVHSTSATMDRCAPLPATLNFGSSTSPDVTKESPRMSACITICDSSGPGVRSSFTYETGELE